MDLNITYNQAVRNIHYIKTQMVEHPEIERFDVAMTDMEMEDVMQIACDYGIQYHYTKDESKIYCHYQIKIDERISTVVFMSKPILIKNEKMNFSSN